MHDPRRLLDFPALLNARDLGGYATRDGGHTRFGSLVRADDLARLTPEGVAALTRFGVETVIDLRWTEEVQTYPSPVTRDLGRVRYRQISLLARSEDEWRSLCGECTKIEWKCRVLERSRTELKAVLQAIAAASSGPLLFHCVAGKDRTGVVAALLLANADVEPAAIAWDYAVSTERLRDGYLARYPDIDPDELMEALHCPEEGVYRMLEHLEGLGGVRGYLELIGLSEVEIELLRARLRD